MTTNLGEATVATRHTLKAWEPYWDCVSILCDFDHSEVADGDQELPEWRFKWIAGVALLRTVGHVLAKVDAATSEAHKAAIGDLWLRLRSEREEPSIFWEFIEKERNNILKTYSFGARFTASGEDFYIELGDGLDAIEVFRSAIEWWHHELTELEAVLANSS